MSSVVIDPGPRGRLRVIVPFESQRVAKIKTIHDHRWHPEEGYWTVTDTQAILPRLLALFAGEPVEVDHSLRRVNSVGQRAGQPGWPPRKGRQPG